MCYLSVNCLKWECDFYQMIEAWPWCVMYSVSYVVVCSNLINVINVFRFPSSYVPSSGYFTDWRAIVYPHCFESVVNCRHNAILTERQQTQQSGNHAHTYGDVLPESTFHGAKMGPSWDRQDPVGPHVGPMNFDIWAVSRIVSRWWYSH